MDYFYVVEFVKDRTIEAVPESWLDIEDEVKCWWPPVTGWKLIEFIKTNKAPARDWKQFVVTIRGKCTTYEKANAKVDKALITSDASEFEENEISYQSNIHTFERLSTSPIVPLALGSAKLHNHSTIQADGFEIILERLNAIEKKVDYLMKLDKKPHRDENVEIAIPEQIIIPVDNEEKWVNLEKWLVNDDIRKQMTIYLKSCSRDSLTRTVCSVMTLLISNAFAKEFNWVGANSKRSFKSSSLLKVVCDSILQSGVESSKAKIEEKIRCWIRQASDRDGGRKKRIKITDNEWKSNSIL